MLQPGRRIEGLVTVDVRVARDRREVGVTKVLGGETCVAELLTDPSQRVSRSSWNFVAAVPV